MYIGSFEYREPGKGLQILLSRTQPGPYRKVKQEQEDISPNHVQAFSRASVQMKLYPRRGQIGHNVLGKN